MLGNVLEFCQNMKISLDRLAVRMSGERAEGPSRIAAISASIEIEGDVPEERLETLLRVAKGCRMHNTLTRPPKIDVDLTVGAKKVAG